MGIGEFIIGVFGSLLAGWTQNGISTLHQRLKEGDLPINHDLEKAVTHSLREALLVFHQFLKTKLKDESSPATNFWLEHFKEAITDKEKLATFGADMLVGERLLHELLSDDQVSDLAKPFHACIVAWEKKHITQPEACQGRPDVFAEHAEDGWQIDPKREETLTVFKAFCLEFHEVLKTDDRARRIYEAVELKEIRELLGRKTISTQEITDPLTPIVNEVRRDIRALTNLSREAFDKLAAQGGTLRLTQREIREVVYANHELLNANTIGIETLLEGQSVSVDLLEEILTHVQKNDAPPARVPYTSALYLGPWMTIGDDFRGRGEVKDDLLAQLQSSQDTLVIGQTTTDQKNVIHGTGGIGKTRLAVELGVSLHPEPFPFVLLIRAESPEGFLAEIQGLAEVLNLPAADNPDLRKKGEAVYTWFQENRGKWLLIIDNVDTLDAQESVYEFVAKHQGGTVLITTRLEKWKRGMEPLRLGVLEETPAIEMLTAASTHFDPGEYQPDLASLAQKLGYLAAALEIAGAYLDAEGLTPSQLLAAWGDELDALIDHEDSTIDYSTTLRYAWQQSIQQCLPQSRELFEMLCLLAPGEDLEIAYLEKAAEALFPPADSAAESKPPRIRRLLGDLARYSLVQRSADSVSVIPVVAEVSRKNVPPATAFDRRQRLVRWCLAILPDNEDYHRWDEWTHLQNHLLQFLSPSDEAEYPDGFTTALNNVAAHFFRRSAHSIAEPLMKRGLKIDEENFGTDHPNVAVQLNNLAQLLQVTNRLKEAELLMKRALAIDQASLPPDHPDVARDLSNLASILQATNRRQEAEPLMNRALAIDEASFGPDHPKVATDLNNLATLFQETNRLKEAEPLRNRALVIDESSFGPDHPDVARDLCNMAALLQKLNRLDEAEPLMRRALIIVEASLGRDHPDVAVQLNNLAQLLKATNRLDEAEPLMKQAWDIHETNLGPDHPLVAVQLNNLAQLFQATNRLKEAEPLMRRALVIDEASFGPNHPNVASRLSNLAQLLKATNRLKESEPLMKRALVIDETSYGPNHPSVARDLSNFASLLSATNRLNEAEPLVRRALLINEASLGLDHPVVAIHLNNLASLLYATNRLEEAEPLMKRHLDIFVKFTKATGHPHPHLQAAAGNYMGLLIAMGMTEEAATAKVQEVLAEIGQG